MLFFLAQWRLSAEGTATVERDIAQSQSAETQEIHQLSEADQQMRDSIEQMMAQADAEQAAAGTPRATPPPTTASPPNVMPSKNADC